VSYTAHESLKNHPRLEARGVCVISPSARAPVGAALEEKEEEDGAALAFERLCLIWCKPDGINKAAAWKAFQSVCADHPTRAGSGQR
jgi:hypothetical protein